MSWTGRPSSPPLALISSSQIFMASSADLPLGASGPVSAMPKPMRSASAAFPGTAPSASAERASAAAPSRAIIRPRKFLRIGLSSEVSIVLKRLYAPKARQAPRPGIAFAHVLRRHPGQAAPDPIQGAPAGTHDQRLHKEPWTWIPALALALGRNDGCSVVIPGRREAANPEPMNTIGPAALWSSIPALAQRSAITRGRGGEIY